MTRVASFIVGALLLASPAGAQSWDASVFVGYTPSGMITRRAPEFTQLDIRGATTWGVEGSRALTPHWAADVVWTQQKTALEAATSNASPFDLFAMTVRQLHGNVVYRLSPVGRAQPFFFGGIGASFFSAADLQSETKLSFDWGAGLDYSVWRQFGVRGQFRVKPTYMHDTAAGDFCDPFGFCQNWLWVGEISVGAVWRF